MFVTGIDKKKKKKKKNKNNINNSAPINEKKL